MSEKFPNVIFDDDDEVFIGKSYGHTRVYSEQSAAQIDEEIARIIDKAYNDVLDLLNEKMAILNAVAHRLLEKEKIEGPEFEEIYVSGGVIPETPASEEPAAEEKVSEETSSEETASASETTEEKAVEESKAAEETVENTESSTEETASDEEKKS